MSVGDNCKVVNSEIENSVIMNDCKINTNGRRILNSLIGPNVTVTSSPNGMPKGYRFILGDRSTVVHFIVELIGEFTIFGDYT